MNGSRVLSSIDMTSDASPVVATDVLLARILLGVLCIAAVAVLSLPQARAASAAFGWTPLWLLATPLSAWLALQLRRRVLSADVDAVPLRHRRRVVATPPRRRAGNGSRGLRSVRTVRAG
jgi:hypothetical protein